MTSDKSLPLRSEWDDLAWQQAKANKRDTYIGDECNFGHGNSDGARRYTKGRGCKICADARRARKANRGGVVAPRTGRSRTIEYRMWQAARARAEAKGLAFTISIDDIVIPPVCPVFGTPMTSPSLDRFDNSLGYTPENIRVISRRANTIKSDASLPEILAIARYMSEDEFDALLR